MYIIVARQA